jgi:hypothetical protein
MKLSDLSDKPDCFIEKTTRNVEARNLPHSGLWLGYNGFTMFTNILAYQSSALRGVLVKSCQDMSLNIFFPVPDDIRATREVSNSE